MAKLSLADKMRIQTLREQGLGAKAMKMAYPQKNWNLSTLNEICRRIDKTQDGVGSGEKGWQRTTKISAIN